MCWKVRPAQKGKTNMNRVLILAAIIAIPAFASDKEEFSRKLEKLGKLSHHTLETEAAAYSADGVDTTGFKARDILRMHGASVAAFVSADGMGIFRREVPVHLYTTINRLESEGSRPYAPSSQELIGIAMHKSPVAYKANYITDTVTEGKASDIPIRKLDDFETKALVKLNAGRDLVTEESAGKLLVVGAIRASKDCMSCHSCKERDLLGAFTYTLTPVKDLGAK